MCLVDVDKHACVFIANGDALSSCLRANLSMTISSSSPLRKTAASMRSSPLLIASQVSATVELPRSVMRAPTSMMTRTKVVMRVRSRNKLIEADGEESLRAASICTKLSSWSSLSIGSALECASGYHMLYIIWLSNTPIVGTTETSHSVTCTVNQVTGRNSQLLTAFPHRPWEHDLNKHLSVRKRY
jgi:hypothetical protein